MADAGGMGARLRRAGRLLRPEPGIATRVAYPHVPKCGGTSVTRALRPHFDSRAAHGRSPAVGIDAEGSRHTADELGDVLATGSDPVHAFRFGLAHYLLQQPSTRFLFGHFAFGLELAAVAPDVAWITLLRDPVDRVLSQYRYNRHKDRGSTRHDLDLDTFLEHRAPGLLLAPVRYLCGPRLWDAPVEQQVAAAAEHLATFAVVGTLDDLPRFQRDLSARFGVDVVLPHANRSPAPPGDEREVAAARTALREIAGPALALHERARDLVGAR